MKINWTNVLEEAIGATISAAFIALVVYIYNLFTGNAQTSSWLWVGLIVFALSVVVAVAWRAFRRLLSVPGRWIINNWQLVIALVATLLVGIAVGITISPKQYLPLDVRTIYEFEDRQDPTLIDPWAIFATKQSHTLVIADEKEFARSGTHSLRLNVELQSSPEYAGIRTNPNLDDIRVVSAWVLIPVSEQTKSRTFRSSLLVYGYDSDGQLIGFRGKVQALEPGVWTSVLVGVPRQVTVEGQAREWNQTITELYLTVWCDKQYSGPIYIDDIIFYTDIPPAD